ncbi:MAG: metalloregulator ArsR/SmtB family transcription factor [Thermoplasmata archaeon]|nr:metalloregulator ArsR/SmtB family transcription factor [Thermoplasmata archaeon]
MSAAKDLAVLGSRLERLTGEEADCCVPLYRDEAAKIARSPRFRASAARARALADERRLLAVALLRRRAELCACEIQAGLGVTHATVSHHMRILTKAGVVESERRGKWMYYRLSDREGGGLP